MRRILHISDLHFGRTNPLLVAELMKKTQQLGPHVVVVSGDLTQRARKAQFEEAQEFLQAIPYPKVVVPGNHDVPLYNLVARFLRSLANYRKYISDDLWPTYQDEEIVVLGMNTARSFTRARGSVSDRQIEHAKRFFCNIDPGIIKILVTHHPFDFPETIHDKHLVRRAKHVIASLAACEADLYLAGHAHVPFAGSTARRYKVAHRTALVVQAGTGISTRTRTEPNSFNLILIRRPYISVQHFVWNPEKTDFVSGTLAHFKHAVEGWQSTDEKVDLDAIA
jgi:3',5'-cyclic AMP phosphodiesterase CpdA